MNPYVNMAIVSVAIFIGAAGSYWNIHENALPIYWKISITFAGLGPVGTYILGRFQANPSGGAKP